MAISYLGGEFHSFYIFMLAEFFTALSIVLNKNSYNAYLIDAYIKEYKNKNFGKALFVYNQYTFLAVAISSFIGTICYQYINIYSALVCAFALSVLFLFFIFLLPSQKVNKTKRKLKNIKNHEIRLIFRKIFKPKYICVFFVLVSLFFQIIIQYCQVILSQIKAFNNYPILFSIAFSSN